MIYIQPLDYKWFPTNTNDLAFEEELAKDFIKQVKFAINTQKFNFAPLSPKYLAYKRKRGLSLNIWEATSQLKNSLGYFIEDDIITIGWDKSLMHKNSNIKVYQVAILLEYGTLKIPPRPLFRNVLKAYIDNPSKKNIPQSGIFTKKNKPSIDIKTSIKESILTKISKKVKSFFSFFKKR